MPRNGRCSRSRTSATPPEVSIDWSGVAELFDSVMRRARTEFPHAADLTMLGAHSSHSYQTGTNLYFVYDYDISCEPREEITVYHEPLNAIVVEEALRLGGSMVHHHGIGKYRTPLDARGTWQRFRAAARAEGRHRPSRHHEPRHHLSAGCSGDGVAGVTVTARGYVVAIDNGSQSTKVLTRP